MVLQRGGGFAQAGHTGQSLSAHFSVAGLELSLPLSFIIILFYVIAVKPLCILQ